MQPKTHVVLIKHFILIDVSDLLRVQLLTQLKGNMEEENRHLAEQNQSLLKENRALLEQSLERRDQHYSQQREYQSVPTHTHTHEMICFTENSTEVDGRRFITKRLNTTVNSTVQIITTHESKFYVTGPIFLYIKEFM